MSQRICILRTDSVLEEFQPEHRDYPEMFQCMLHAVDGSLEISAVDVREGVPAEIEHDGYLITGSRHSVYDELDWIQNLVSFLQRVLAAGKKVVGICFGHQLLAHYFGGRVAPAKNGWAVGVHTSKVVRQTAWMEDSAQSFAMISSHKDQVTQLPIDAEIFATNEFCPIAGFTIGEQVMTVQGHPEFSKTYSRALMDYRKEIIGPAVHAQGVASLQQNLDSDRVALWIVNFFRGDS